MKLSTLSFAVLASLVTLAAPSVMADSLYLGTPSYGGPGCPQGTASVNLSPDQSQISILFDQYTLAAGGFTGKTMDRKSCNVAIPVHIPQGYSISIFQVDYRGFNALPAGGSSQFRVEYFLAGMKGPTYTRNFSSMNNGDFTISNTIAAEALIWSACGKDVILRTNSAMAVRTNSMNQDAQAGVDSIDIDSGLVYHIQWRACN